MGRSPGAERLTQRVYLPTVRVHSVVRSGLGHATGGEPSHYLGRVEPNEPADPQERHSPLGDQTPDVAGGHPKPLGDLVHGQQLGHCVKTGHQSSPRVGLLTRRDQGGDLLLAHERVHLGATICLLGEPPPGSPSQATTSAVTTHQGHRSQAPPHPPVAPISTSSKPAKDTELDPPHRQKHHAQERLAPSPPKISSARSLPLLTTTARTQKSLFTRFSNPGKPPSEENTIASRWLAEKSGRVCRGGVGRWAGCG